MRPYFLGLHVVIEESVLHLTHHAAQRHITIPLYLNHEQHILSFIFIKHICTISSRSRLEEDRLMTTTGRLSMLVGTVGVWMALVFFLPFGAEIRFAC